jgi:hypothetical protein
LFICIVSGGADSRLMDNMDTMVHMGQIAMIGADSKYEAFVPRIN